jgi:hypothetical protein
MTGKLIIGTRQNADKLFSGRVEIAFNALSNGQSAPCDYARMATLKQQGFCPCKIRIVDQ